MRMRWLLAGALTLLWTGTARAHELDCEKVVELLEEKNGVWYRVPLIGGLSGWMKMGDGATLRWILKVENVADATSRVQSLVDPLLEFPPPGFEPLEFDPAPPFDLPEGEGVMYVHDFEDFEDEQCEELDCADGFTDGRIVNTFTVAWDGGFKTCHAILECRERRGGIY